MAISAEADHGRRGRCTVCRWRWVSPGWQAVARRCTAALAATGFPDATHSRPLRVGVTVMRAQVRR